MSKIFLKILLLCHVARAARMPQSYRGRAAGEKAIKLPGPYEESSEIWRIVMPKS